MVAQALDQEYLDWIKEKFNRRTMVICFDDYQSQVYNIKAGLDQGCLLSVILYNLQLTIN